MPDPIFIADASPPALECAAALRQTHLTRPDGRGPMVRHTSLLDLSQTTSDLAMLRSLTNVQRLRAGI